MTTLYGYPKTASASGTVCGDASNDVACRSDMYIALKAAGDVLAASVLLVVTAPLILVLLGLVRATSPGPALYSQVRLGRGGRPFRIFKIRTMTHDCERLTGPCWSTSGDPRVTPLGRVLRQLHLDELPQLWNVLRGEMSLVGPRPERPEIVVQLERALPDYRQRLTVRPGVTGLAQVQLPPDEDLAGVRRKLAEDLCYIRLMGPWLDARIAVGTALKVAGVARGTIGRVLSLPSGQKRRSAMEPESVAQLQST